MEETDAVRPGVEAELAGGLEEGLALDVADGPADLGDDHIRAPVCHRGQPALDLLGDMRITWTVAPRYSPRRSRSMTAS